MSDYSKEAEIWSWMKSNTAFSDEAICGIMGNMHAESDCEPCRKQGDFSSDRQTSKDYAASVDAGLLDWNKDSIGWGLCQWTYWTRKKALHEYCLSKGKSVADLTSQLEFMMQELGTDYSTLYASLLNCKDIKRAAALFCQQFERPAVDNSTVRANAGQGYYAEFHGSVLVEITEDEATDSEETVKLELPRSVAAALKVALLNAGM